LSANNVDQTTPTGTVTKGTTLSQAVATAADDLAFGVYFVNQLATWTAGTNETIRTQSASAGSTAAHVTEPATGTTTTLLPSPAPTDEYGVIAFALKHSDATIDVKDNIVSLVRAGSVAGDNKADTSTIWPATDTAKNYGGSGDMWGTTLTPAQVNANDFGVVLSVSNVAGLAEVDAMTISVYYQVAGAGDPGTYVCVLEVDAAKTTVTPTFIKLARAGLDPANDPNIDHAASDADFLTPRYYTPDRSVSKVYRALTCWLDLSPVTNTPGLQIWATVDDGAEFQMLDGAGAPAEFTTSGAKRLFFPKTAAAVGHWVQFRPLVPALTGGEVALDATIRNVKVYGVYNPVMTQQVTMGLILRQGQHQDGQREQRSPDEQTIDLEELGKPQSAATTYKDPQTGETGYFDIEGPRITEMRFKSGQQSVRTAVVRAKVLNFE